MKVLQFVLVASVAGLGAYLPHLLTRGKNIPNNGQSMQDLLKVMQNECKCAQYK